MHDAPSVTWPVGRSHWGAAITLVLWGAAAAVATAWTVQTLAPWRLLLAWAAVIGAGALAAWGWWGTPAGTLAWDGAGWTWAASSDADQAPGGLQLSLDLQHAILVRWHDGSGRRWFWLERRRLPERWDDLRRAVYSRARPEALPAAGPPAAKP